MKHKILGFILWGLLLFGIVYLIFYNVQSNLNGYQFSELSYEKVNNSNRQYNIYGSIKNISNTKCNGKKLSIKIELKSGSITDIEYLSISNPTKGNVKSFKDIIVTDLTNFEIKVKEVDCWVEEDTK